MPGYKARLSSAPTLISPGSREACFLGGRVATPRFFSIGAVTRAVGYKEATDIYVVGAMTKFRMPGNPGLPDIIAVWFLSKNILLPL